MDCYIVLIWLIKINFNSKYDEINEFGDPSEEIAGSSVYDSKKLELFLILRLELK